MRILYFDTRSLLYSNNYLNSHPDLYETYNNHRFSSVSLFLQNVAPDPVSLSRLSNAAQSAGLLLYPTGIRFTRNLLIEHGLFDSKAIAPDINLPIRMQIGDDTDPFRRLLAHAHTLAADWYVCGEVACPEQMESFPGHFLESAFGDGVTEELTDFIRAL